MIWLFLILGFCLIAYYAFAILIMPAFWILLAIGALYYVGGWWLGVPAIIASLVIIGMWES